LWEDGSGWVWAIPLHNSTTSVGVVMNQAVATQKKKGMSSQDFYLQSLKLASGVMDLLSEAELTSTVKATSDWSYSASFYASPYVRIAGDAGCFIDPFFSSGVHLALASALSAAVTISAAKRGDVSEKAAWKWHTGKVADSYTRFLLIVLSALKQIMHRDDPVLADWDEESFDRAFALFRPST
jgi:flavin-dependent dehydrogenase